MCLLFEISLLLGLTQLVNPLFDLLFLLPISTSTIHYNVISYFDIGPWASNNSRINKLFKLKLKLNRMYWLINLNKWTLHWYKSLCKNDTLKFWFLHIQVCLNTNEQFTHLFTLYCNLRRFRVMDRFALPIRYR